MTKIEVLIQGLKKFSADMADLANLLEADDTPKVDDPVEAPDPVEEAPAKVYSYEEVRAILAEKS